MAKTKHDYKDFTIPMTRGNLVEMDVTVTRTVGGVTSPQSLASGSLRFTVRRKSEDTSALFELTTGDGIATLDAEAGTARVTIPTTATADLANYEAGLFAELVYVDADSNPRTLGTGRLTVFPGGATA